MDAHAVLGVASDATIAQIKAAYREQARVLHPDRHVGPDGTAPASAQQAFVELNLAFRAAVREQAVTAAAQASRAPHAVSGYVPGFVPPQARRDPRPTPARDHDPMLALLTLPMRCREPWPDEALQHWAMTLTPAARRHLAEASRVAGSAGATGGRCITVATAHALLTLTLRGRFRRGAAVLNGSLPAAYTALEAGLPAHVVAALPPRVTEVGGRSLRGLLQR